MPEFGETISFVLSVPFVVNPQFNLSTIHLLCTTKTSKRHEGWKLPCPVPFEQRIGPDYILLQNACLGRIGHKRLKTKAEHDVP